MAPSWLSRVWARGVAVHRGRLTLDALEVAGILTLRQVMWEPEDDADPDGPLVARLVDVVEPSAAAPSD